LIGQVPLPLPGGGTALVGGGPFEACPPGAFGLCLEERAANAAQAAILLAVPDFGLPKLPPLQKALAAILVELPHGPVYIGCRAGLGRTGTVLACLARLSGVAEDPVTWVRRQYDPRAIETAAQEHFARHAVLRG
jgi:protein-tyrosine phosphatase